MLTVMPALRFQKQLAVLHIWELAMLNTGNRLPESSHSFPSLQDELIPDAGQALKPPCPVQRGYYISTTPK